MSSDQVPRPKTILEAAQEKTDLGAYTVSKAFEAPEALDVVSEITGKQRGRVFAYAEFLKILESGPEVRTAAR